MPSKSCGIERWHSRREQTIASRQSGLSSNGGVRKKGSDGKPYAPRNPDRDVPYFKTGSTGYHTWTPAEVRQFEERHPIGTKAWLALSLLLFTGQRRSDITRFGRQHVRDGEITFTQYKGRNRKPKQL